MPPRPNTPPGEGIRLSFDDIAAAFGRYKPHYLDMLPPEFNVDEPSAYPVRVVVEVEPRDGTNERFPRRVFYLLLDLSPTEADELLKKHRGER